mmetsp:Transcript_30114/g.76053  ORF Transcript_30114/g.76053 Transcript_30114/m.76053 type:complete len:232 (+) Transcript_30114:592-1287(+)
MSMYWAAARVFLLPLLALGLFLAATPFLLRPPLMQAQIAATRAATTTAAITHQAHVGNPPPTPRESVTCTAVPPTGAATVVLLELSALLESLSGAIADLLCSVTWLVTGGATVETSSAGAAVLNGCGAATEVLLSDAASMLDEAAVLLSTGASVLGGMAVLLSEFTSTLGSASVPPLLMGASASAVVAPSASEVLFKLSRHSLGPLQTPVILRSNGMLPDKPCNQQPPELT